MVGKAVADAFAYYELDLPVSSEVVSCWICNFWLGTEPGMLAGTGQRAAHLAALDAVEDLLRRLDTQRSGAQSRRVARGVTQERFAGVVDQGANRITRRSAAA